MVITNNQVLVKFCFLKAIFLLLCIYLLSSIELLFLPYGLRVCRFAPTTLTREIIFGGEHAPLTHPENPEDTGSPQYHLLDDFPPYFARGPYGPF